MAIDKSQIREIKDFQLGSEVATNMKFNFDMLADEINKNENSSSPDALVKTEQTLTEEEQSQVQTNIGVKNTVDLVGAGTPVKVTEVWQSGKYRNTRGLIENISSDWKIYKAIKVNIGDVVIFPKVTSARNVSLLSHVSDSNDFISTIKVGKDGINNLYYVSEFNGYIEVSTPTDISNLNIIPCQFASALTPLGGPNRKLYEAAGAKFNEKTGFYELNGLTDITEEEMSNIYSAGAIHNVTGTKFYISQKIRTNLPFMGDLPKDFTTMCQDSSIETFTFGDKYLKGIDFGVTFRDIKNTFACFYRCNKLHTIYGYLVPIDGNENIFEDMFQQTPALRHIKISGLNRNLSLSDSPLISKESLQFITQNSKATSPITITLHADVYAKVASAEAEWGDIFTLSQSKNISFVQG